MCMTIWDDHWLKTMKPISYKQKLHTKESIPGYKNKAKMYEAQVNANEV